MRFNAIFHLLVEELKGKGRKALDFAVKQLHTEIKCSLIPPPQGDGCGGTELLGETRGRGVRSG